MISWLLLAIAAALLWAFVNVIDKYVLTKWVDRPLVPLLVFSLVSLAAGIAIYLIRGFDPLSLMNTIIAMASGGAYVVMVLAYLKAVMKEEMSRVVPLFYLAPVFVLILAAFFLGESLFPMQYAGVGLVVAGAILLTADDIRRLSFGPALGFMALSAFASAVEQVMTKYVLGSADYWTVFAWSRLGAFIIVLPLFFTQLPHLAKIVKKHGRRVLPVMALGEALNITGILFITMALAVGSATLVNTISSVQPFFVLLMGIGLSLFLPHILKEELGANVLVKILATAIMFAGVLLIA